VLAPWIFGGLDYEVFSTLPRIALTIVGCRFLVRFNRPLLAFLVSWLVLGLGAFLAAFAYQNHWLAERYMVPFLPPLAVLQITGFCWLADSCQRLRSSGSSALIVARPLLVCMICAAVLLGVIAGTREASASDPALLVVCDDKVTEYCLSYYREKLEYPHCSTPLVWAPERPSFIRAVYGAPHVLAADVLFSGRAVAEPFISHRGKIERGG
jgi:hypothetical protein